MYQTHVIAQLRTSESLSLFLVFIIWILFKKNLNFVAERK